jgi:succinate dehydrogenase/fumarate reductase cytochrome b subunit
MIMMDLFSTKIGNVDSMIINPLILLLFALAVVYFLYGVLEFFMNQENEEKKTQSKSHMLWGIVGITIMLGVFAIINIILTTFNISGIKVDQNGNNSVQLKP